LILESNSETETREIAEELASVLKPGDCITLSGELGAGKSVFARAMMRALGVTDEAMPSPTFAIIQEYVGKDARIAHMDWYRLDCAEELEAIGVREYMQSPWISIIEWPERAPMLLPVSARQVLLRVEPGNSDSRLIEIND